MKQSTIILIIILLSIILCNNNTYSQNIRVDNNGNYIATTSIKKSNDSLISTGKTFTDAKGIVYPVYKSTNDKLFVIRTSKKTGNQYKMYLKL